MNVTPLKPDARPLYEQARALLLERIRSGVWAPGSPLPNEFQLAAELGVSQGTVRKALNALADEKLVVRRQGRGTYVAEHTPADVLFRFFQIYDLEGNRVVPESQNQRTSRGKANANERARLKLASGTRVIRHSRIRTHLGTPFIDERIVLPDDLFADLGKGAEIPNTLYDLFQRKFGVTVGRADEKLTAALADRSVSRTLGVPVDTPLLRIDRVTYAIDSQPIEWRISLCHLDGLNYAVELR